MYEKVDSKSDNGCEDVTLIFTFFYTLHSFKHFYTHVYVCEALLRKGYRKIVKKKEC